MRPTQTHSANDEQGFALIALVVVIFVILLFLGIAAPKVARDLRRDRELESIHRGNQYVRAIQLYYKKFGRYPGSIEQLEKSNNVRFLRKQYVDPMTGKPDWRLILVGQNKTTVKGLFGEPLAGLAAAGAGGIGGANAGGGIGGSTAGNSVGGATSTFGSTTGTSGASSAFGASPGTGATTGGTTTAGSSIGAGIGSQSATDFKGGGGPFMGVGHAMAGDSIVTLNEQTDYSAWEFLYDPRIEQLKAHSNLFGGGAATSATSTSLGGSPGSKGGSGTFGSPTSTGTTTAPPATPPQP